MATTGRPLKVFSGWSYLTGVRGQVHVIVAAQSQTYAAACLGATVSHLRSYMSETGNEEEIALATSKPGTVFWRPMDDRDSWTEYPNG